MSIAKPNEFSNTRKCKDGIIPEYLRFTEEHEAPVDFHLWTCIGVLASALGRDIWFPRGNWVLYPNLYVILVAESALARKSTSLQFGIDILKDAFAEDKKINLLSQKLSPEYFIHSLAALYEEQKRSEATIHASELSVLLGKTRLDDSFVKILTDLYDSPNFWTYGTIARGQDVCNKVCLNILGGSTPEWLRSSLPEETLGGGFFSRLIMVNREPTGKRNPNPEDMFNLETQTAKNNIVHDLKIVKTLEGAYQWSRRAKDLWTNWYMDYGIPDRAPKFMRGYYGRKGDILIKLSMIMAASRQNSPIIEEEDFMFSNEILRSNEDYIVALAKQMDTSKEGQKIERVRKLIERHSPIAHSKLMQSISHQINADELEGVLQTLLTGGEIKSDTIGPRGKRVYFYVEEADREN